MVLKCDECKSEEFDKINGEYVCRKCGLVSLEKIYHVQELNEPSSYHQDFYENETVVRNPNHRFQPTLGSYIRKYGNEKNFEHRLKKRHRQASSFYTDSIKKDIKHIIHPLGLNNVEEETVIDYYIRLYKKGITNHWKKEISVAVLSQLVLSQYGKFIDTDYIKSVLKEDYKDKSFNAASKDYKKNLNINFTTILPLKAYYDFYKKALSLYEYEYEILSFLQHIENHEILINKKRSKFVLAIIKLIYKHFGTEYNIEKYLSKTNYYLIIKPIIPLIEEFFSQGGGFKEL